MGFGATTHRRTNIALIANESFCVPLAPFREEDTLKINEHISSSLLRTRHGLTMSSVIHVSIVLSTCLHYRDYVPFETPAAWAVDLHARVCALFLKP